MPTTEDSYGGYAAPGGQGTWGSAPGVQPRHYTSPRRLDGGADGYSADSLDSGERHGHSVWERAERVPRPESDYIPGQPAGQLRPYDTDAEFRPAGPTQSAGRLSATAVSRPSAEGVMNLPPGQARTSIPQQTRGTHKKALRGMAAAMTAAEDGAGEFKPIRSPLRPRQFIIAVIAVALGAVASVLGYRAVTGQPGNFSGQVTPAHAYYLNFANNAAIQTVNVRPGQTVKAGTVLATQNGSVEKARLSADDATVKADQAALSQDQAMQQAGTATPATVAQARASLANAQAQLAADQSAVGQSEIVAPATGVVADVTGAAGDVAGPSGVRGYSGPAAEPGTGQNSGFKFFVGGSSSTAGAGSSSASGFQSFITLYTQPLTVTAQIPQQDLPGVHVGQRAALRFPTLSKPVSGTVELIIGTPVRSANGTFYDVVISIGADQADMTPGMTVDVTLR